MKTNVVSVTYEIELQPGEELTRREFERRYAGMPGHLRAV